MKKLFVQLSLAACFIISTAAIESGNCDSKTVRSELKHELVPDYRYDSSNITEFTTSSEFQGKKIEIPLFKTEKYRFVFNTEGTDKNFQIYVSNKKDTKSGKILFALKDVKKEGQNVYTFDVEGVDKLYVTYVVPPSLEQINSFCVAFMIGYKL